VHLVDDIDERADLGGLVVAVEQVDVDPVGAQRLQRLLCIRSQGCCADAWLLAERVRAIGDTLIDPFVPRTRRLSPFHRVTETAIRTDRPSAYLKVNSSPMSIPAAIVPRVVIASGIPKRLWAYVVP